jgi:hypothetical protein
MTVPIVSGRGALATGMAVGTIETWDHLEALLAEG